MGATVGVSVLFTDLVGSTELATRVGAAEAERLRTLHFALLRAPLQTHRGREVKNLGDGIMAVFPGLGSALDTAIAMQQAFAVHNTSADGPELMIRVGVATGDCVEEDGDYFGEPVIQAARLCAKAADGQILAPDVVRILAPRGAHEFNQIGALELKGLPEPMPTVEVVWHPAVAEPLAVIRLADRITIDHGARFVGRDAERDTLRGALKAASGGARQVVLVSGEAGLGKTRLATEIAHEAFDSGALVLYGRCDEELIGAYRPWVELFGHYVANASEDDLARHDRRSLAELALLVPAVRDRVDVGAAAETTGGAGDQYVLFAAVTALLATLAADQPVVILLDDLHWGDRPTLQLLRHVIGTLGTAAVLVIGTYRETDVGADHPLTETLAALRRETGVERLALSGLSDTEVIAFLETTAGHDMDDDGVTLAHALRAETGGNPFFVGELLLHLAESGVIARQTDGRWAATVDLADVGLPQSVREVVGARVRRLGDEVGRVLAAAAVAGRDFDVAVVAGAVDLDDEAVLEILETAMPAGLVREVPGVDDRFTFNHALVQHTLYTDLAASRRARLHRRIAETIEELVAGQPGDRVGELANHWFAATKPAELDRAIGYAIEAGEQALAALAPTEAVRWYRQALDAIGGRDDLQRCDVLVRLGDAERQAGDAGHRDHLLQAAHLAQQLDNGALLVAAALANNRGWHSASGQVDADRVAVLEAALAAVGQHDSRERARLLTTLADELAYSGDSRRFDLTREGIAVARRSKDPATILDSILRRQLDVPDLFDERRLLIEEAMRLTDGSDGTENPVRRYFALDHATQLYLALGDTRAARRCNEEAQEIAGRLGQATLRWMCAYRGSLLAFIAGNLDEAERLANETLEVGVETGQPDATLLYGIVLMCIRWSQGREHELTPLVTRAVEDNPGLPVFRGVLAWNLADIGDLEGARQLFDALATDGLSFPYDQGWLQASIFAAETARLLGDRAAAAVLYDRLAPFADQIALTRASCLGAVSHYLGHLCALLGRADEAEALLLDALDRNERLEAPFFRAKTMLALADVVQAREPDRARTLVAEALALADTYGLSGIRKQALAGQ